MEGETVDRGVFLPVEMRKSFLVSGHDSPEQTVVRKIGRLDHLCIIMNACTTLRHIFRAGVQKVPKFYTP